jgi:hypothetical protein
LHLLAPTLTVARVRMRRAVPAAKSAGGGGGTSAVGFGYRPPSNYGGAY